MKDLKKYLAEFIGTAVLVGVACGVAGQVCDVGGAGPDHRLPQLSSFPVGFHLQAM